MVSLTDGLLHCFEFDEASGDRIDRVTGVGASPAGIDTTVATPGQILGALATDQTGAGLHGVQTPLGDARTGAYWGGRGVSFAFWIQRFSGFSGTDSILNSFYGDVIGPDFSQNLNIRFNNTLAGAIRTADGGDPFIAGTIALPVNTWVHVAWTYDQDTVWQYYIDGQPGESLAASGPLLQVIDQADVRYRFGYTDAPTPGVGSPIAQLHGLLDQFCIYDREISQAVVQALYNGGAGTWLSLAQKDLIELPIEGAEIAMPLVVQSLRFAADPSSVAGDRVRLVDPVSGDNLWQTVVAGPVDTEAEVTLAGSRSGRTWPNGVRVAELTGDRGRVFVRLA